MAFIKKFYGYLMKVQFRLYAQWAYATTQLGRVVQSQQQRHQSSVGNFANNACFFLTMGYIYTSFQRFWRLIVINYFFKKRSIVNVRLVVNTSRALIVFAILFYLIENVFFFVFRSYCLQMFLKLGVLKNFVMVTGKLVQESFFNK